MKISFLLMVIATVIYTLGIIFPEHPLVGFNIFVGAFIFANWYILLFLQWKQNKMARRMRELEERLKGRKFE